MEAGYATGPGLTGGYPRPGESRLVFVVPRVPTERNLLQAFKQGLQGDRPNEAYLLEGRRCPACGTVELVGWDRTTWNS